MLSRFALFVLMLAAGFGLGVLASAWVDDSWLETQEAGA